MHRPRLQPGQAELVQPFVDSTRMHLYREPPLHDAMEIRYPPAHHLVRGRIASVHHQLTQLGHLRLCHVK